jgi:hypothetical protein
MTMLLSHLLAWGGLASLATAMAISIQTVPFTRASTPTTLALADSSIIPTPIIGYDLMSKQMADLLKDTDNKLNCDTPCKKNILYPWALQAAEEGFRHALWAYNTTQTCLEQDQRRLSLSS